MTVLECHSNAWGFFKKIVASFPVGVQNARNSQNVGPLNQSLEKSTGFELRPWERLPNSGARSKNVGLKFKVETY